METDPEGRPLARWWQRVLAILIDGFVIGVPASIALTVITGGSSAAFGGSAGGAGSSGQAAVAYLVVIAVALIYFGLLDGSARGQTIGKMALGIATRDAGGGGRVGFGRAVLRRLVFYVLFWLFFVPGILNVLSPLWDRRRQAWHDKAGTTVVVKVR